MFLAGFVFLFAAASWIFGGANGFFNVDRGCANNAFGCNAGVEFLGTTSAIALAFVYFTSWRVARVARRHLDEARTKPWSLVPTATEVDKVVGRDGLCEIVEQDLTDKRSKRPQIIVGGVGDGKTAVLIGLTKLLFERGAVPVPIGLRSAKDNLDFVELAKDQFAERVERGVISEEERDKVWRELCAQRLIVILADGLEEAVPGIADRASVVQAALERVRERDIPLVIASRPDPVLEEIDAAIIRLEPLPIDEVIAYIKAAGDDGADERVVRLAQTAQVMERPLYLMLARELNRRGKVEEVPLHQGRVRARFKLLEQWREALIEDRQGDGTQVDRGHRARTLRVTEAMACVGMATNTLDIALEEFEKSPYGKLDSTPVPDAKLQAERAVRLNLVEIIQDTVRFRHSIMQAYLGARHLGSDMLPRSSPMAAAGEDGSTGDETARAFLDDALCDPGRELMIALVMSCLVDGDSGRAEELRDRLLSGANGSQSHTRFELLAAAYEIDALVDHAGSAVLADTACRVWQEETEPEKEVGRTEGEPPEETEPATDVQTIEAKLRAILPMAEAGHGSDGQVHGVLWHICRAEDAYAVRFQAAQALAGGGNAALEAVRQDLEDALEQARTLLTHQDGRPPAAGWRDIRRYSMLGWVMPLLAATCEGPDADELHRTIEGWVELASGGAPGNPRLHLGVEAALAQGFKWEANRGANRAGAGRHADRPRLIQCALDLLDHSHWWHTQITLLQALALWALDPEGPRANDARDRVLSYSSRHPFVSATASLCSDAIHRSSRSVRDPRTRRAPSRYIWIDEAGLAAKIGPKKLPAESTALLWIPPAAGWHALTPRAQQLVADVLVFLNLIEGGERSATEGSLVSDKEARIKEREERRLRVHRRGSALPGCLTDADDRDRLRVGPPCAKNDHEEQGDLSCDPANCDFNLCPYPKREERPFRGELNETFCREQQRLLRGRDRRLPAWERTPSFLGIAPKRHVFDMLGCFWRQMEARNQGPGTR